MRVACLKPTDRGGEEPPCCRRGGMAADFGTSLPQPLTDAWPSGANAERWVLDYQGLM